MAVMDADTGKLLNYRQVMRSTKYREAWSLSSANKSGRLANGIGGRIKNPTNTIKFIFQHEVPTERMKNVTYGQFLCITYDVESDGEGVAEAYLTNGCVCCCF
jgi:hypothetical protein